MDRNRRAPASCMTPIKQNRKSLQGLKGKDSTLLFSSLRPSWNHAYPWKEGKLTCGILTMHVKWLVILTSTAELVYPPCYALQWTLKLRLFYNGSVMLGGTCIIITYSASPLLCNQSPPSVMWQDFVWLLSVVSTGTWQALYQRAFLSDPQEFMHKHVGHNVPRKPDSLLRQ